MEIANIYYGLLVTFDIYMEHYHAIVVFQQFLLTPLLKQLSYPLSFRHSSSSIAASERIQSIAIRKSLLSAKLESLII